MGCRWGDAALPSWQAFVIAKKFNCVVRVEIREESQGREIEGRIGGLLGLAVNRCYVPV